VLVLGGGFTAFGVSRALRPLMRQRKVRVTVLDRENFLFYHGLLAEFLVGRLTATTVLSPARRIFPPARFHQAEIEEVDLENRTVTASTQPDGIRRRLAWDHLVIGLGSADNLELYPGLGEHAFRLKAYHDVFHLRNHILRMFELAEIETDPDERQALLTFFIAGGGYAGTEVSGELADLCRILTETHYRGIRREECRVVLVEPGATILPEMYGTLGSTGNAEGHPELVRFAAAHIASLGVEAVTGTRVTAVSPGEVTLSDGRRIRARTIISAVGTKMPALLASLDVPKDERGKVTVEPTMRVPGFTNVWAGGDNALVPHPDGGYAPPRALEAIYAGRTVGRNIARTLQGAPLEIYRYRPPGQGVPLGAHTTVGELKGVEVKGTLAFYLMKAFLIRYTVTWDRRLHLLSDWLINGLTGRDVAEVSTGQSGAYELRENVFQPGEIIVREGREGRYLHVILEGEVEILSSGSDGTLKDAEVTATLKRGDTFGQAWLDQTAEESARAKDQVRTVTLRTDQSHRVLDLVQTLQKLEAERAGDAKKAAPARRPAAKPSAAKPAAKTPATAETTARPNGEKKAPPKTS
jgi:NADH dehydrogenase